MIHGLTRRSLLLGTLATAVAAPAAFAQTDPYGDELEYDPLLLPPPESPIDYPIEPVDLSGIPERFRRQIVNYKGFEPQGTVIVRPAKRVLLYVLGDGQAIRYGVGVGREGFGWSGEAEVRMKRRWPRWVPPKEMVKRDKNARKWANGQPGGPENPLGARALYLFSQTLYAGFSDSGYRIHGTNAPETIGKAMSSGCIRMLNQDVAELFERTPLGTRVIVKQGQSQSEAEDT
jgi:lipoprotein-anchoring transpeptidase ErfK/SrfK